MNTSSRTLPWLLALLVVVAFAFQGTRGIWEPDEGRYSSAGLNMHESGDWVIPTVDGEHPHLTKPPMTYWALASSFALLGHNEWAARLPSALAFIGTGLFVFGLGRRLCPTRPWLPAVVWALSLAPVAASNIVSTDPLLAFFETAAMFAFVEAWSRSGTDARRWYVLMWLGWGLAFLTKGPPGLLPLLGMIVFLAFHDRARLRALFTPVGLLLFALVAFSWFGVVIGQDPDRLNYFLGYEVRDRIFTDAHKRNSQWYGAFAVYLPMLLLGTMPWLVFALRAGGGIRPSWATARSALRERQPQALLLACWLLVPLLIFCLARSRLQLYILPLFVPLALIMARPLASWPGLEGRRLTVTLAITLAAMVALKGVLAYVPSDRDARALARQLEQIMDPHDVDEIVFVGMRPFYGLNVYLDKRVEGVDLGERRFEYSKFVAHETLCQELATRERAVYGIKQHNAGKFIGAAERCGWTGTPVGSVYADGARIEFFLARPRAN
ncbi:MAG TPA: glycosyltransferase family 39 protein [Steroidobacteraceae bacterium]